MSLATQDFHIIPNPFGILDSNHPDGSTPVVLSWDNPMPNYLNQPQGTPLSINFANNLHGDPGSPSATLSLLGSPPPGWSITGYSGTGLGSATLQVQANRLGVIAISNQFQVQSIVAPGSDVTAPTIPTGVQASGSVSGGGTITVTCDAASDPVIQGATTSGLQNYQLYEDGNLVLTNSTAVGSSLSFTPQDVGSPAISGIATQTGANWSVIASGAQIGGLTDSFNFVYGTISGNCEVIVQVQSFSGPNAYAKCGVMLRGDLTPAAACAHVTVTQAGGVGYQMIARTQPGQAANNNLALVAGGQPVTWLKLTRVGNLITGYYSTNGNLWITLASVTVPMQTAILAGICTCAQSTTTATASFQQLNVQNIAGPTFVRPDLGIGVSHSYQVLATDLANNASAKSTAVTGTTVVNPPVWQTLPNVSTQQGVSNTLLTLSTYCADPQSLPLTFALATGTLPSGITLSSAGVLSYDGTTPAQTITGLSFRASNGFVSSVSSTMSVTLTSSGAGVKFHAGHYIQGAIFLQGGTNGPTWVSNTIADIDSSFAAAPNALGYMILQPWAGIETAQDNYSGMQYLDQVFQHLVSKGKRFGISIYATNYFHTNPTSWVPSYILGSSTYGPGYNSNQYGFGYWQLGTFGAVAAYWRPAVLNRLKLLFSAIANRTSPNGSQWTYDTDPNFECITSLEFALSVAAGSDVTTSNYDSSWQQQTTSMVSSFPHCNLAMECNFVYATSGPADARNIAMVNYIANAGGSLSGPDMISSPLSWGQQAYDGSAAGSTDQRGKAPYDGQVQYPDYPQDSLQNMFNACTQTMRGARQWWGNNNSTYWPSVASFIQSTAFPAPPTPQIYVNQRGGINTT
jgi:hypothetical protein